MKKQILVIAIIASLFYGCITNKSLSTLKKAEKIITPSEIQNTINIIASDSMKGRNTPSKEIDSAAKYIANQFQSFGIKPLNNSYFQKVVLFSRDLGTDNFFKISKNGTEKNFKIKDDYIPFEMTADNAVSSQMVFVGYGITAPEYNYDDYKDIDVNGKIVVVLSHEPQEEDTASVFEGKKLTANGNVSEKVRVAISHGAIGMILITDPLNHKLRSAVGYPWPSLSKFKMESLPIQVANNEIKKKIPVIHADEDVAAFLFSGIDSLEKIQRKIDKELKPNSFIIDQSIASIKINVISIDRPSQNVVGYIEGTDTILKNEWLVIGAHYDHVGFKKNHKAGEDFIFNGADDNASGTAGVIAIAKTFANFKEKPKRSVLFVLFAGEEKGLFGSYYYVNNPLVPLKSTVAMLNLDMISRNSIDSLILEGSSVSPDITKIIKDLNKKLKFNFVIPVEQGAYFGGSDHYNFYKKDIPMIFFFSGTHQDYHQVSDNPDKINADKAAKVAKLAFSTAWYIANDDKHYKLILKTTKSDQ